MTTRKMQDYALYKGDELIAIGTAPELAKLRGVKVETIRYYATRQYRDRRKNSKTGRFLSAVALGVSDDV